jgi:GDPmannose 4,6-dehydratase
MDSSGTVMIFGHNGQDGTLLRESLALDGIRVVGVSRGSVDSFDDNGGLVSSADRPLSVRAILEEHRPIEIYYLAAEHHSSEGPSVAQSASEWATYFSANVIPYESVLEAVANLGLASHIFYAASSRVFEGSEAQTFDETTPFAPLSPYARAKARGVELGQLYRSRGVWVSSGVLFNHESHLRPRAFFSSKVVLGAIEIAQGSRTQLAVADLSAHADWGYARDFVKAFRLILAAEKPDDFIIATGESNSSERFIELAFERLGLDWRDYVVERRVGPSSSRPVALAQPASLVSRTDWSHPLTFEGLVSRLVSDHLDSHNR